MGEIRPRALTELRSWPLQDARARFSEMVREALAGAPQRVTMRGQDDVVVMSAEEYTRLVPGEAGSLGDVLRQGPFADMDGFDELLEEFHVRSPVRSAEDFSR